MSAPAQALAVASKPIVKVRLADAASSGACVSLLFSLLLIVFPKSFPDLIVQNGVCINPRGRFYAHEFYG